MYSKPALFVALHIVVVHNERTTVTTLMHHGIVPLLHLQSNKQETASAPMSH
jgi:hypothetical protein